MGHHPIPKADSERTRRNTYPEAVQLDAGTPAGGPSLAEVTCRDDWSPYVQSWWDGWRTSPQAAAFLSTDWNRLGQIAFLMAEYEREPKSATLAEIRLNEERLGATHVDRLKARMNVGGGSGQSGTPGKSSAGSGESQGARAAIADRLNRGTA